MSYELECRNDSRASFYGKARIEFKDNKKILVSYTTDVAYVEKLENGFCKVVVLGQWSNTTTRHIKEFLKQEGFKAENMKQILKDYGVEKW